MFKAPLEIALLIEANRNITLPNGRIRLLPEWLNESDIEIDRGLLSLSKTNHIQSVLASGMPIMYDGYRITDHGKRRLEDWFSDKSDQQIADFVLRELSTGGSMCLQLNIYKSLGIKLSSERKEFIIEMLINEELVEEDESECPCGGDRWFKIKEKGMSVYEDRGYSYYMIQKEAKARAEAERQEKQNIEEKEAQKKNSNWEASKEFGSHPLIKWVGRVLAGIVLAGLAYYFFREPNAPLKNEKQHAPFMDTTTR